MQTAIGILGVLAVVGLAVFLLRRRKDDGGDGQGGRSGPTSRPK